MGRRPLFEDFQFLDPWTLLLPDRFPCVLAVAGQGAKSTLIERLTHEYQRDGRRVLLTRTSPGPAPAGPESGVVVERVAPDSDLRALARDHGCEVVIVEAQDSCGSLVWPEAPPARWPRDLDLGFAVANLQALGRRWSPEVVHLGREVDAGERRVTPEDLLAGLLSHRASEGRLANGAAWVPFLSGFGALRDIDAMFTLGQRLVAEAGARLVCFGELRGDPRRDAADRASVAGSQAAAELLAGDRIYAIHPALA